MRRPEHRGLFVVNDDLLQQDGCSLQFDPRVYSNRLLREFVGHAISFIRAAASDPDASLEERVKAAQSTRSRFTDVPSNANLRIVRHGQ